MKNSKEEIYSTKCYAQFGGVSKTELLELEYKFIININFNLYVNEDLFNKYYDYFADEDSEEDDEDEEEKKEIGVRTEKNREENKDNEKREQNVNSKKIKYKGDQKQNG